MAPLSPHAKFGPQQVLEYTVDTVESDEEDVPADLAEKLKSNERGVNGTPRRRKISYVQVGARFGLLVLSVSLSLSLSLCVSLSVNLSLCLCVSVSLSLSLSLSLSAM